MKRAIVGSFYWTTGPLVIGARAAQKVLQQDRDREALKTVSRTKKALTVHAIAKQRALVFPGQFRSTWVSLGKDAGVLIRIAATR
jgi:hypothetical protein